MTKQRADLAALIAGSQRPDGSWESWSVAEGSPSDKPSNHFSTTFTTATIAGALAHLDDPVLDEVKERAADFLVAQASEQWSYNYWARGSDQATAQPYPDDWDDTACALAALMQLRPEALDGAAIAKMVQLLTATEVAEGGPYRTWIVGPDAEAAWQDVDLAVNANIGYLLHLQEVELPNLTGLADQNIANGTLSSPYYPSAYPIVYFLSRWYEGSEKPALVAWLERQVTDRAWGDPLQAALLLSGGRRLGAASAGLAAVRRYLEELPVGELGLAYGFCYDPVIEGQAYVAGAPSLTAALILEALALPASAGTSTSGASQSIDSAALALHDRIMDRAMKRFEVAPASAQVTLPALHKKIIEKDPAKQITLLPYLFAQALGDAGKSFAEERLEELGLASLYGWVAYTIYDDFLDNEGLPVTLPLANIALRELVLVLGQERSEGFAELAWSMLDRMEAANSWEVSHCRIARQTELLSVAPPDYGDLGRLADRSIGHALGCLAMLMELGYETDSVEMQSLEAFFRHFLIARQLSDEAHDWRLDLENGHINAVGAMLLSGLPRRGRRVAALFGQLEQEFWGMVLDEVCDLTDGHLDQARAALRKCPPIRHPEVLEALLSPIAKSSRRAREERARTVEFLGAYESRK